METLFNIWKDKIEKIISDMQIEHVGASSIPGAETKGDLDISVQTTKNHFIKVSEAILKIARAHHPEIWTKDFAVFSTYDQNVKIDIMVVVKDSEKDTFAKTKNILISNPSLLSEYNSIKKGLTPRTPEYYAAKKAFFNRILLDNHE